ncbi:MAG TPA: hypothetical protein VIS51_01530 [Solirubrobacterales bacterium]
MRGRRLAPTLSIFGFAFLALAASAQAAPANDDFLNATPLSGPPLSAEFDDNEGATKQTGEPNHAGNAGGHSVWYSWTPSIDTHVVVSTCTIGGDLDSLLAVYTGSAVNSLSLVASNDERAEERCNSTDSEVEFTATAGVTYRIAVDGKGGSEGPFGLVLKGPAPNDEFANAETLESGAFVPGTTELATKQDGEPNHAGNAGGHSVWYSWTPSSSGEAFVSTCEFFGSFNTLLAVYTGSAVSSLTPVASNGAAANGCGPWTDSEVAFDATAGVTYRIAVDGEGGGEGSFELRVKAKPDNDEFANARVLGSGLPAPAVGATTLASKQSGEPNHAGNAGGHSVWYSWTPSSGGPVSISTCSHAVDNDFNTLLAVYTGSTVAGLTTVASNDNGGGCKPNDSKVAFTATAGVTYRIAVDGKGGSEGNFKLMFEGSLDGGGGGGATNGDSSTPALPAALPVSQGALEPKPKPLKCKPRFRKTKVHGKVKCVKKKGKHRKSKHRK